MPTRVTDRVWPTTSAAGSVATRTVVVAPALSAPAGSTLNVALKAAPFRSTTTTWSPKAKAVKASCAWALIAAARSLAIASRVCRIFGVTALPSASTSLTTCAAVAVVPGVTRLRSAAQISPRTGIPARMRVVVVAACTVIAPRSRPVSLAATAVTLAPRVKAAPLVLAMTTAVPSATARKPAGAAALKASASLRAAPERVSPATTVYERFVPLSAMVQVSPATGRPASSIARAVTAGPATPAPLEGVAGVKLVSTEKLARRLTRRSEASSLVATKAGFASAVTAAASLAATTASDSTV